MKQKLLLIASVCFFTFTAFSQSVVYEYDNHGNKVFFQVDLLHKCVAIDSSVEQSNANYIVLLLTQICGANNIDTINRCLYSVQMSQEQQDLFLNQLGEDTSAITISNHLLSENGSKVWCTNKIFVQMASYDTLVSLLNQFGMPYKSIIPFAGMENVFLIEFWGVFDKSLEYANILFESELAQFSQPNFGRFIRRSSNPYYTDQWGLKNTGQNGGTSGLDINVEGAWFYAEGEGVKVAVIDEGIELTHPDLSNNLLTGYDATQGAVPGNNGACKYGDYHGTTCAGVIAAVDNNIGVKGVAYKSKIIPIRISYEYFIDNYTTDAWVADGIYKSWHDYNADVLLCAWEYFGGPSSVIETAISNALTQGRSGRGSIVVFAAGNHITLDTSTTADQVSYPANCDPGIIVVGAMSPCGERKTATSCDGNNYWESCYGNELDVVAPGVLISTTDNTGNVGYNNGININDYSNTDYTHLFGGTSAAASYVAGVAALVLSVNNSLTAPQVARIIKGTSQKVGNYTYTYSASSHLNGTWNIEMGHGLVDATTAVQKAMIETLHPLRIRDSAINIYSEEAEPNINLYNVKKSPDIWFTNTNDITSSALISGNQYKIKVNIQNRSNSSYTLNSSNLIIKWALGFPSYWNSSFTPPCTICDCVASGDVAVPSGSFFFHAWETKTISINFTAPTYGSSGFLPCPLEGNDAIPFNMVAYVNDGGLTIGANETTCPIEHFVRANNNVAWTSCNLWINIVPIVYSITPNPTGTQATISYNLGDIRNANLIITGPNGNIIYNMSASDSSSKIIDVQSLPAGRYEVRLVSGGIIYDSKPLIISH